MTSAPVTVKLIYSTDYIRKCLFRRQSVTDCLFIQHIGISGVYLVKLQHYLELRTLNLLSVRFLNLDPK